MGAQWLCKPRVGVRSPVGPPYNKYLMHISSINSVTFWENNVRKIDVVKTYEYDNGTAVKVVSQQSQMFSFYDANGSIEPIQSKGNSIDVKV